MCTRNPRKLGRTERGARKDVVLTPYGMNEEKIMVNTRILKEVQQENF